ncbi:MAG: DUF2147 domain-containing protein [Bacteroidetes bacterium]|nr:MAG: DUF2147 domain-containing protein [Bacteroidota bacterium]
MKKLRILLMVIAVGMLTAANVSAQDYKSDDLLGVWLNEDEDAHIEIYKEGDLYFGKTIWYKFPIDDETGKAKLDKYNPDPELQKRPSLGIKLLTDFEWDEDNEWDEGDIYDPKTGKTYSCYIVMKEYDLLKIRGYIGISLIGKTTYWTRVKE